MADKLRSKAPAINVQVNTGEARKAAAELGKTLNSIAAGIPLNEYFRDTTRLIDDVRDAYSKFQRELSYGAVDDATAQSLMKTANALTALAAASKQNVSDLLPEFNNMQSAIAEATKQAGMLSAAFSVENYKAAFDSFKRLEAEGVNLDNVFKNLGGNANYDRLLSENQDLRDQLAWAQSDAEDLRRELERLDTTDLTNLEDQLSKLRRAAVEELDAFFKTNNIPKFGNTGYDQARIAIEEFGKTSSQAIANWKAGYGSLLGQAAQGTGSILDPQLFEELSSRMQPFLDRINDLEDTIRNGGFGGTGNADALGEIVNTLAHSEGVANGATELLGVMERIASGDFKNLEMMQRALSTLGSIDQIKISKAAMTNLGDFFDKVQRMPNLTPLAALSSINLNGFNNLSIKKASLENLATYLPAIANVNIDALERLSNLPLNNLNGLTIKVDLGKERFEQEAMAVDNLNKKFREHAGAISAAIAEEGRKYATSVQLTEQLKREKDALDQSAQAGGSNDSGTTKKLESYYKEQLRLSSAILQADREKIGSNQEETKSIDARISQLKKELTAVNALISAEEQRVKNKQRLVDLQTKQAERIKEEATKNPIAQGKYDDNTRVRQMNEYFSQLSQKYSEMATYEGQMQNAQGQELDALQKARNEREAEIRDLRIKLSAYQDLVEYSEKLASVDAKYKNKNTAEQTKADIRSGRQADQEAEGWNKLAIRFKELGTVSDQFANQYKALQNMIQTRGANLDEARQKYDELSAAIRRAKKDEGEERKSQKETASVALTYDKLTNKVTTYFHKFESEIKRQPALMAQYEQLLNQLGVRGFGETKEGATQAAAAVQKFQLACEQADVGANSLIKKLISGFGNKLFYGGMAKLAAEVRRLAREIYTVVQEIDSSLTQLRIVTGGSAEDMARYYDDAAASAKKLAVSIKDVIDSTTTFARLGYSASESNVLAEYTAMLTKVGDIDTQAATNAVTALVKAFDLDISDVQTVMDQMVEVGNNFPISVSQLAEGMNNAGSALAAAGNTVEQSFALLTAANTTVQDISKASTALRTMSARIRRTSASEMPDGEEAVTESKYDSLVQALTKHQVALVDMNNEYRSTYDIIKDIAGVWDQMNSMEQAAVTEAIASTRNQNVFLSMVTQFQEAEGALVSAQGATGAMSQAYDAYLESVEGHIGTLKADFQDLSTTILNSNVLKFGIDVIDGLVKIIDYLAEIKILLPGIAATIASINVIGKIQQLNANYSLFMQSIGDGNQITKTLAMNFAALGQSQQQYIFDQIASNSAYNGSIWQRIASVQTLTQFEKQKLTVELSDKLLTQGLTVEEINAALAVLGLADAEHAQTIAAHDARNATLGFAGSLKLLWQTNPVGLIMTVASTLATILIPALSAAITTTKELREEYENEQSELTTLQGKYDDLCDKVQRLNDLKAQGDFSEERQKELDDLTEAADQLKRQLDYKMAIAQLDRDKVAPKIQSDFVNRLYTTENVSPEASVENMMFNSERMLRAGWRKVGELNAQIKTIEQAAANTTDEAELKKYDAQIKVLQAQRSRVISDVDKVVQAFEKDKAYFDEDTLNKYQPLIDAWQSRVNSTLVNIGNGNTVEQLDDTASAIQTVTEQMSGLNTELAALKAHGGNVDLNVIPRVKITDQNKGVLSNYGADGESGEYASLLTKVKQNKHAALLFTPVLPNGQVLSEKELNKYMSEVVKAANADKSTNYAAYDEKGLLVGVFGDHATFEANKQQAEEFADEVRNVFDEMYNTIDTTKLAELHQQLAQLAEYNPTLASVTEKIADFETQFKKLAEASEEFATKGKVAPKTLNELHDAFGDLNSYDNYIKVMSNTASTSKDVQDATKQLAMEYLAASNAAELFTDDTQDIALALLKSVGFTGSAEKAMISLKASMIAATATGLDFAQQKAQLLELAAAAGVAQASINSIFTDDLNGSYANVNIPGITTDELKKIQLANRKAALVNAAKSITDSLSKSINVDLDGLTGGGGKNSTDKYIADLDPLLQATRALNEAQERRAKIERELNRAENGLIQGRTIDLLQKQIAYHRQITEELVNEQSALHELNDTRDGYIHKGIELLEQQGFIIEYDDKLNKLDIKNREHLNELSTKDLTKYELMSDMSLEVIGKYDSAQEASNELIKHMESIIKQIEDWNDANKENSLKWWDIKESIAEADKKIKQLLKDIVDQSSAAVDQMQSVYDTLHKAADEYASSGFVTIDTVQALIGLGTEYMQYLLDENGQLIINEERIKAAVKAKMDELAIDNALVYVESLSIAKTKGYTEELNRLLFATEAATQGTWDLVYAQIEALKLSDEERAAAYHNVNSIRALAQSAGDAVGNEFEQMKRGVDDILKYVQDMLKHQSQEAIDALNKQKEAYSEIIDQQKEALQLKKKENDYNKSVEQKLKDIAKLQAQIDALSLDNSREAQAQRAKLLEELAEQQSALSDEQNEHAITAQEEALDAMNKAYSDQKDKEIEMEEKKYASAQQLYDASIKYIEEHWETLYSELLDWNTSYGSVLNSEITTAWENCLAAAQRYGDYVTANNLLGSAGEEARNTGVVGQSWGNGSSSSTPGATSSTTNSRAAVRGLIEEMKANSAAWHSASGDERTRLSDRNKEIATVELPKYGLTGVWIDKKGVWRTHDGSPLYEWFATRYHSGGIVGDSTMRQDELFATLQKGEMVLTNRQQEVVANGVDFMSELKRRLNGELSRTRVPSIGMSRYLDYFMSSGDVGGTTVTFGDVYITGTDKDNIAKYREVNREFVNDVIKVLNIRR